MSIMDKAVTDYNIPTAAQLPLPMPKGRHIVIEQMQEGLQPYRIEFREGQTLRKRAFYYNYHYIIGDVVDWVANNKLPTK